MLETVLRHWDAAADWRALASRTGLTDAQLRTAVDDLLRLGYLQAERPSCGGGCAGCKLSSCEDAGLGRTLSLTAKGKRKSEAIRLLEKNE